MIPPPHGQPPTSARFLPEHRRRAVSCKSQTLAPNGCCRSEYQVGHDYEYDFFSWIGLVSGHRLLLVVVRACAGRTAPHRFAAVLRRWECRKCVSDLLWRLRVGFWMYK